MNPSIGTQVCEATNIQCFHHPGQLTESEQCLGSATNMFSMFKEAEAFNQPLAFDTAEVTSVRVYLLGVQSLAMRGNQVLISYFLWNLLSDARHVLLCRGLQSTTIFQY